jgi:hypothetical protein
MKRNLLPVMVLGLVLLSAAAALAGSDIYGGGPWGTKITSLPYPITAPGAYYLGGNLSYAGGPGITIASDDVTLDLMGFTLTGSSGHIGIYMDGQKNVEIRNGTLSGWYLGIYEENESGVAHRIINVRFQGTIHGVQLGGPGHLIQGCQATGTGAADSYGFVTDEFAIATVTGCTAKNFTHGIMGNGLITGNVIIGDGSADSIGIWSGDSLIMGNEVSNFLRGIIGWHSSVIGNTVNTPTTGSYGIIFDNSSVTLVDQNRVLGPSTTPYSAHNNAAWRTNY